MREIKFRAWDGEEMISSMEFMHSGGWENCMLRDFFDIKGRVMQYTGLEDKNGKEIYEGDVVDYPFAEEIMGHGRLRINTVEWDEDRFRLTSFSAAAYSWDKLEVIGNVYENPELIK